MKLAILAFSAVFCVATAGTAQVPGYARYRVKIERPHAKKIDFRRSPGASTFRTRLTAALRQGTDFAGRYKIAAWGCGTGCISGAVIDTRTGRVYFPEELAALSVGYFSGEYESEPLQYRADSRMLKLSGIPGRTDNAEPDQPWGEYYYEWKNNRFYQLKYIKRDNPQ